MKLIRVTFYFCYVRMSHEVDRRQFIGIATLLTGAYLTGCSREPKPRAQHPTEKQLSQFASLVVANGPADAAVYVALWKHMHGGRVLLPLFRQQPAAFYEWFEHQQNLFKAQVSLIKKYGVDNVRVLCEGLDLGADGITADQKATFEILNANQHKITSALDDEQKRNAYLSKLHSKIFQGESADPMFFNTFGTKDMLSAYCWAHDCMQVIAPAEPADHWNLHTKIKEYSDSASTKDQSSASRIDKIKQIWKEDSQIRHDYIAAQISNNPKINAWSVVLGSGHFNCGVNPRLMRKNPYPLELVISRLKEVRSSVWEDNHFKEGIRLLEEHAVELKI